MKYYSKHNSYGNSVQCKYSAGRQKSVHWIERLKVALKVPPWAVQDDQACLSQPQHPSRLSKVRLSASRTLLVSYSFSSGSSDNLSKLFCKIRLKWRFVIGYAWLSGLVVRSRQRGIHIIIMFPRDENGSFLYLVQICHSWSCALQRTRK